MGKKIALSYWLVTIIYFAIYIFSKGLQNAVNQSTALSYIHAILAFSFIIGLFAVIVSIIRYFFRP